MLPHRGTLDVAALMRSVQHILLAGSTGGGKTYLLVQLILARLRDPRWAVVTVDPEGDITRFLMEYCANPCHGLAWRGIHFLQPADATKTFSLPLLKPRERTPQACHEASLRALAVLESVVNFGAPEFGPRLSKLLQLGLLGLALTDRPLLDLPELFAVGQRRFRELIEHSLPYEFLADELRSLDVLSDKNPLRFLEYCESVTSRLMPTFSNPMLRRIFGQRDGLDIGAVLAKREAIVVDLSNIAGRDAVLLGASVVSLLFHECLHRPPETAPRAFVAIDEVFDYMTTDLARSFDRLRKRNVQLCVAIQRMGQLQ